MSGQELLRAYRDVCEIATRLNDALISLHDFQNGCPLPKYERGWTQAMKDSREAMDSYNEFFK